MKTKLMILLLTLTATLLRAQVYESLSYAQSGNTLVLSWPPGGWQLQETTNLYGSWLSRSGAFSPVVLPINPTISHGYFRLLNTTNPAGYLSTVVEYANTSLTVGAPNQISLPDLVFPNYPYGNTPLATVIPSAADASYVWIGDPDPNNATDGASFDASSSTWIDWYTGSATTLTLGPPTTFWFENDDVPGFTNLTIVGDVPMQIIPVPTPPSITTQPQSQNVVAGTTVTLTVVANGSTPLGYQWNWNGAGITGATSNVLTIAGVSSATQGNYQVIVTNSYGSVTSSVAVLTIQAGAPATTVTWTNTAGGNWSGAANWSPNRIPGASDIVGITTAGTYTVTMDENATVAGLVVGTTSGSTTQTFLVNGQTLTLNGQASVNSEGVFDINNGSLAGFATVAGTVNWSGGTLNSGGSLTVATNGVLNFQGNAFFYGWLTNNGTVNWQSGTLYQESSQATFNMAGAQWNILCDGTFANPGYGGWGFNNFGVITKSGTSGTTQFNPYIGNWGQVTVQSGTIQFGGNGGQLGGVFHAASGAAIYFSQNYTWDVTGSFQGPGVVQINSGNVAVTGSSINYLAASGVTISGLSNVVGTASLTNCTINDAETIAGAVNWSGGTLSGSGSLTVATNGVLNLTGGSNIEGPLTNNGTVNWQGGGIAVYYNTILGQYGAVWNQAGAQWNIQCDQALSFENWGTVFNNAGTVTKTTTTGTTTFGLYLSDSGLVQAQTGTIQFNGGGTLGGTFQAATGTAIYFGGNNNYAWTGTTVFQGPGVVQINSGNVAVTGSSINYLAASGVTISGLSNVVGTASLTNCTINDAETIAGAVNWSGGTLSGSGSLMVATNGVLNLTGGCNIYGPLTNNGTVNWLGGGLYVYYYPPGNYYGQIWNQAGAQWNIQCDQTLSDPSYRVPTFNNAGTVTKNGTSGNTTVNAYFNNSGVVDADQGVISLINGASLAGSISFEINGTNNFGSVFVSGSVAFGGMTAGVIFNPSYSPHIGNSFALGTYGSLASSNGPFAGLTLPNSVIWQTNYGTSAFTLSILSVQAVPTSITWTNPAALIYGTPLTAAQLDAMASVPGTYAYTPPGGTVLNAGTSTLKVVFTPTDTVDYLSATSTVSQVVLPAALAVTANSTARAYGLANPTFTGTLVGVVNGDNITATYATTATSTSPVGTYSIIPALVDSNGRLVNYSVSSTNGTLTVNKATPAITTAPTASPITYGQTLANSTLSGGGASAPGVFAFTTPSTAPNVGTASQGVTFTPADTTDYYSVLTSVSVTVNKLMPAVTWTNPAAIVYGASLGTNQLNATANTLGTFAYAPLAGIVPNAGTNTLTAVFTPTNTVDYSSITSAVSLVVSPAPLTVTASNFTRLYGQANPTFGGVITGVTNGDNITATYAAMATTTSPVGTYSIIPTLVDPGSRLVNYAVTTNNGTLMVNKATPTITTAPTASAIIYGQTLANSTLSGGVGSVPGSFAFTTPTASPGTGTASQSVTFIPTDTTDYNTITTSVSVTVTKATPTITTAPTASPITYGQTLASSTLSGGMGSVPGSFAFTIPSTAPNAGTASQSVMFTPADTTDYNAVILSVSVTVNEMASTVTWTNPAAIIYGVALGTNQLDATASIPGAFVYTPPAGTVLSAGTNALTAVFTPTNTVDYASVTSSVSFVVSPAGLTVTANNASRAYGAANPVFGGTVTGVQNGDNLTATFTTTATTASPVGTYPIVPALVDPGSRLANYKVTTNNGTLTITKATPTITATPTASAITYGQTLANSTLTGGTGSVPGSFTFTSPTTAPGAGTATQSVTFIPMDSTDYNTIATGVSVTVYKAAATLAWLNPAAVTYGTALSALQLNVTSSVPGSFAYTPAAGTILTAGTNILTAVFTPADTSDYSAATNTVNLVVNRAALTVTANSTNRVYGEANPTFTGTIAGIQNSDNITATYGTTATTSSPAGMYPIIPALADPNSRLSNYAVTTNNGILIVSGAAEVITWATPAAITYGATLSSLQLNATSTVAGAFVYSPSAGTVLDAGTNILTAVFTPTDTADYTSATNRVTLIVQLAALNVTAYNTNRVYGITNPAFAGVITGIQNEDDITVTYHTSATNNSPVGNYLIIPVLDDPYGSLANYIVTYNNGTLAVTKAPSAVTWATPAAIGYGTVLSAAQLNATSSVPGTLAYTPAVGTVLTAGTNSLTAIFTPTDSTDYSGATNTVALIVNRAALAVTANSTNRIYGVANPAFTGTIAGLQNSDNITATFSTTATSSSPVGAYPITSVLTDPSGRLANYAVTTNTGTLTIGKAGQTVTWAIPTAITYGTALSAAQLSATSSVTGTFAFIPAAGTVLSAGSNTLTAIFTPTDTTDYAGATNTVSLNVNLAALTLTANNASRAYGLANPTFIGTITGIKNSDNITATYVTTATISSPVGTYPITPVLADPNGRLLNYSVTTNNGTLTIGLPPQITTQPTNQTADFGADAQFSVVATGSGALAWQWWFNQTNLLSGSTTATLILTNVTMAEAGLYSVTVSDAFGSTNSAFAQLTVAALPSIISCSAAYTGTNTVTGTQSAALNAVVNPNNLTATAWFEFGMTTAYGGGSQPVTLPATNANCPISTTLPAVVPGVVYHYEVVVSNSFGEVTSPDQTFYSPSIYPAGETNADGVVNQSELNAVLANYWPNSPWVTMTNVAGMGTINVQFALTNANNWDFSVLVSTNLTDWQYLGPATPMYQFTDPQATNRPTRYYRLQWP